MENTWYFLVNSLIEDIGVTLDEDPSTDIYFSYKKCLGQVESKEFIKELGKFTIKYTNYNYHPKFLYRTRCYGLPGNNPLINQNYVNDVDNINAKIQFYEDGILIKELDQVFENPCIILHGDGQTRKGTKFTLLNGSMYDHWIEVYDLEFNLIRKTLSDLPMEDLFDTNHDYFLTIADTYNNDPREEPHLGIVKKSDFFADDGDMELTEPYDSHRIGLPTRPFANSLCPAKVTKDKMIMSDGREVDFSDIRDFDFDPECKREEAMSNIFTMMGFPSNFMQQLQSDPLINESIIKNGKVCINIKPPGKSDSN